MTVNEILAGGWYVDRKSRPWHLRHDGNWQCDLGERKVCLVTGWYMRLLIERDQHRDVCPGLYNCMNHPVPIVWYGDISEGWCVDLGNWHSSLPEAMDAARALAVGE